MYFFSNLYIQSSKLHSSLRVPNDVRIVIDELSDNSKYRGECPCCGESFRLKDTGLFYLDDLSQDAKICLDDFGEEIEKIKGKFEKKKEKITKGAPKKSLEVNVGNIVEKVAPALPGFPYGINDCRFMAEPIDYVIFNGISSKGIIEELIFMDIKTGNSKLNKHQRLIKTAIEQGKVEQMLY